MSSSTCYNITVLMGKNVSPCERIGLEVGWRIALETQLIPKSKNPVWGEDFKITTQSNDDVKLRLLNDGDVVGECIWKPSNTVGHQSLCIDTGGELVVSWYEDDSHCFKIKEDIISPRRDYTTQPVAVVVSSDLVVADLMQQCMSQVRVMQEKVLQLTHQQTHLENTIQELKNNQQRHQVSSLHLMADGNTDKGDKSGAVFNCTTCGTPKKFEHPSWKSRKGADSFCSRCRAVKPHKNHNVEQAATPGGSGGDNQPVVAAGSAPPPVQQQQQQQQQQSPISIDELWSDFVQKLASKGVSPEELIQAQTSTVHESIRDLGYDALSSARIQTELQHRAKPPQPVATSPQPIEELWPEFLSKLAARELTPEIVASQGAAAVDVIKDLGYDSLTSARLQTELQHRVSAVKPVLQEPVPDVSASNADAQSLIGSIPQQDPIELADGTTSVTGLDEDGLLKRTQKLMEDEIKKMDDELKKLQAQVKTQPVDTPTDKKDDNTDEKSPQKPPATPPGVPYPEIETKVPVDMWPVLLERLVACGLTESDIESCSTLTFEKVLLYLSFNPLERARLIQEFTKRYGANLKETGPAPPAPEPAPEKPPLRFEETPSEIEHEATPLDFTGPPTGANISFAGGVAYETETNIKNEPALIDPSDLHRFPNWHNPGWPSEASAQPPSEANFNEEGFDPVLKCVVHPERDVEFWCLSCESLVCSLCHITGFHKDHPFIPMPEAARKECPGLADWQTRATQLSAKLQDTKISLDEVHSNIDDYHQQQIDTVVEHTNMILSQLATHKDNLIKRIQGHAAAQHQLFTSSEDKIKGVREMIEKCVSKMDTLLSINPDILSVDDSTRWAQGVMKVRSDIGTTFNEVAGHPISIPNYMSLKFNNEVIPDDLYSKLYLTKIPTPVGMTSYVEIRDLSHPLYSGKDRLNFMFVQPSDSEVIQLDNNHLTASYTGTGSGHVLVKGSATFEAGRHYWEVRIDSMHNDNRLGTHVIVGLVSEGTSSMGSTTGLAWCVDKISGMIPMALECPPWTTGSLLGIFLDLEMDRVGLYYNKQCVAHVAIPHGRYTPAASIHCYHDQITLIPKADIPTGVSLTSGLIQNPGAYKLAIHNNSLVTPNSSRLLAGGVQNLSMTGHNDPALDTEVSFLQDECLKLRQNVNDAKREISEQQRVQAQQNFQEQQIRDLKAKIDETAKVMAHQALSFEQTSSSDLQKLQEFQRNQLEEETKRAWQMQVETTARARDVKEVNDRQHQQSNKLERFLRDQQVQITQTMLDRQERQDREKQIHDIQAAQAVALQQETMKQQVLAQQRQMLNSQNRMSPQGYASSPGYPVLPTIPQGGAPVFDSRAPSQPHLPSPSPSIANFGRDLSIQPSYPTTAAAAAAAARDSTAMLRDLIDKAGRLT